MGKNKILKMWKNGCHSAIQKVTCGQWVTAMDNITFY